jgi:hypothetical protein
MKIKSEVLGSIALLSSLWCAIANAQGDLSAEKKPTGILRLFR